MIVLEMRFLYQTVIFIDFDLRVEMWERWIILHPGVCCEIWVFLHHTVLLKSFWPFVEKRTTGQPRSKALPHAGSKVREPERHESGWNLEFACWRYQPGQGFQFLTTSVYSVTQSCIPPFKTSSSFFFSLSLSLSHVHELVKLRIRFHVTRTSPFWETSSTFRILYDLCIKKTGIGEELKVSLEQRRWVTLFKIQLVNRNCRNKFLGFGIHMDLVGFLALQTPTNLSSPTSLGKLISWQRSGEVTFPQLFVAREQSLPFLRIPFPGRSSGILSTSFRREAFSKGFFIPFEYRLDRFLCTHVYS